MVRLSFAAYFVLQVQYTGIVTSFLDDKLLQTRVKHSASFHCTVDVSHKSHLERHLKQFTPLIREGNLFTGKRFL